MSLDSNAPPLPDESDVSPNALPDRDALDAREGLSLSPSQWTKEQALKIVKSDFQRAASWRLTNIEPKWMDAMDTYLATQPQSVYWKGTRTPRANLQAFQAFQQINALRPQVLDALTGSDLDFDVEAKIPGQTVTQVHEVRTLIQYMLRSLGGEMKFLSFRSLLDKITEDGLVLGNGCFEYGWDGPRTVQTPKWSLQPETITRPHPLVPQVMIQHTTGRVIPQQTMDTQTISRFFAEPVEQVDFYIDPLARSTNVQSAEFCARRKLMSIEQLAEYRGQDGFDVPSDLELYKLSRQKFNTEGDTTREYMLSAQGVNAAQSSDNISLDPRLARVEVIRYWQKNRHVWLIGRSHVMWNGPNYYQCLPFFNWCYVNKPGAFYGFSIPELLEGDQSLIRSLMNGRVDEIALLLHPPTISKRGTFRTASQQKFGPGENWEADDADKDIKRLEMGNVTQDAAMEIAAAENRAQKKTGVTDLAVLGTPTTGGNSANRTATGVQAQTNASNSRVHGSVANIEDTCVGPMLNECWGLIQMFLTPDIAAMLLGQPLDIQKAIDVLNFDPRFVMKTANNMKMRAAMQNGGLAQLTQYVLNPEILTLMSEQQGKVLDIEQFTEFYLDVYGVKSFLLFRPETPNEQQAKQARQAQAGQEKMGLQQARLQQMSSDAHERDETSIMVALINALAQAGLLNQVAGVEGPVQLESRRLDAELMGGQTGPHALSLAAGDQQIAQQQADQSPAGAN